MLKSLREYENLHITLWLLKDTCWVMLWKLGGVIMIAPTLGLAIHIAYKSRKNLHDFFHNIAVCLWICANAVWMVGEFFYEDSFRNYALVFFILGLLAVSVYYVFYFPKRNNPQNQS